MERFLVLSSTDSDDAKSITDVILAELTKAGLTSSKILSQLHDGASVMARHCARVQSLFQERENRKIPYARCLNHQSYLLVVKAMSVKQAINNFLHACCSLHNFFASPQFSFTIMVKS